MTAQVTTERVDDLGTRAEGVGFEPTMSFPIPVFKTGAIGH